MNDLSQMIQVDRLFERPVAEAMKAGVVPVYFTEKTRPSPRSIWLDLISLSREIWGYHNYTGLMQPWHDDPDPYRMLTFQDSSLRAWLWTCNEMGVHWKTYCVLSFLATDYLMWERPALLVGQRSHWSWVRVLRQYAGEDAKLVDDAAFFLLEFIRLQIETYGKANIPRMSLVGNDFARKNANGSVKKKFVIYEKIIDRLRQLKTLKLDYYDWMGAKFRNMVGHATRVNGAPVSLIGLVNVNSFDPDLADLRTKMSDPWRPVREFLGLMPECEFPDGSLPKGWMPASDDVEADRKRIVRVTSDGYYYYEDGTQRRGRRHYATNKYLTIKTTPESFPFFKPLWGDPRLLSGNPTWEEYSQHALYPGIWDETGKNISEKYKALKNVRWRK